MRVRSKSTAPIDGAGMLNHRRVGQGTPVLILHGWSSDLRSSIRELEPCFEGLAGWERIYLDLPGHGESPAPPEVSCQDEILASVLSSVDRLIPARRFAVIGLSAGAYQALGIAHLRPDAIAGLMLAVPVTVADPSKRNVPPPLTLHEDPDLPILRPEEEANLQGLVIRSRGAVERLLQGFADSSRTGDKGFQASLRGDPSRYAFSFEAELRDRVHTCPSLILAGRQDSTVGWLDPAAIAERFPRGSLVVLDRAGHYLPLEQPRLFRALAREWLARVAEAEGIAPWT